MLMFSVAIIIGLIFLVLSADRFVAGSAAIANNLGVPHIIIGVTIVSIGTSAPEIIAAALMSLESRVDMALGNAIGSNIANIGLVLGVTALIAPIPVSKRLISNENLIMMAVTVGLAILLFNLRLAFYEGIILLLTLTAFLAWIYQQNKNADSAESEFEEEIPSDMTTPMAIFWFVAGLAVLILSARALVWGAVGIANTYGISDAIIGATIIAIGTSLPELAASAMSAIKKHHDIAIGNILGSNIFNLLAVIAVPALLKPSDFSSEIFTRDYSFMLGISALLFGLLVLQGIRGKSLGRAVGMIFVVMYGAYGYLAYQAAM